MLYTKLSNGSPVYDLLQKKTQQNTIGKYTDTDIIGLRIHGLLGDFIRATTIISPIIKQNPQQQFVILITNPYHNHRHMILDIAQGLIKKDYIADLFFTTLDIQDHMKPEHIEFFIELGCLDIIDYCYNIGTGNLTTDKAYLGFDNLPINHDKIALFRYSGLHNHIPLRHIPERDWLIIEEWLLDHKFDIYLYGYDDYMLTMVPPDNDYRRKLSIYDTLLHSSDAGLIISTTTFFPLYHHHWKPCLVLADPRDIQMLITKWRSNEDYIPIDTQATDYKKFIIDYIQEYYSTNDMRDTP